MKYIEYTPGEKRPGRNPKWKRGKWGAQPTIKVKTLGPSRRERIKKQLAQAKRVNRNWENYGDTRPKNPERGKRRVYAGSQNRQREGGQQ